MIYNVYACYPVEVEMLCSMCTSSNVRSMCISASTYTSFMQASNIHGGLYSTLYSHVMFSMKLNDNKLLSFDFNYTYHIGWLQSNQ